ncbi:aminotransferase class V-fold PLP-dependent enzyme [Caballeronia sp. LjRoot34]
MLASQRHLFAIGEEICYLDSAAITPTPERSTQAAVRAASSKAAPWARDPAASQVVAEEVRRYAAALIGAEMDDLAIVNSISYGLATAASNLALPRGARVLLLEGEHSSQCLTWKFHADRSGAMLEFVPVPADGDWTAAILECISRPCAAPLAVASIPPNMWSDGAKIDLVLVSEAVRKNGAAFVIDATQAVGVMEVNVRKLRPDFLMFPAYKWLLGPYSLAFLYVAPHMQAGVSLEQNGQNRKIDRRISPSSGNPEYLAGARRFDMGERDSFIALPTTLESLKLVSSWSRQDIEARVEMLTDRLASALSSLPLQVLPKRLRSPHILGIKGCPPGTQEHCKASNVFVSERSGSLRIGAHVFNTEADVDRCSEVIAELLND